MAVVTFGTTSRNQDGRIIVPVSIDKGIYDITRENFNLVTTESDGISGISDYELYGPTDMENRMFELQFDFFDDKHGEFSITARDSVKDADLSVPPSLKLEDLTSASDALVAYATHVPFVQDYEVPHVIETGKPFDITLQFNVVVTELGRDDFIFEGVNPGSPSIYRFTNPDGSFRFLPVLPSKGSVIKSVSESDKIIWTNGVDINGGTISGSLTDLPGIKTVETITSASNASEFNSSEDLPNSIVVVTSEISSGITKTNAGGSSIGMISKGDVFQYEGENWINRGNLTSLPNIETLTDIDILVQDSLPEKPVADSVFIFSSVQYSGVDIDGWVKSSEPTRDDVYTDSETLSDKESSINNRLDEESQFFILRFSGPSSGSRGVLVLSLRDNSVRGVDGSN